MSTYSLPSTSQTWEPWPWLIQTACGCAICQLEVAPPASDLAASAIIAVLRGWRRTNFSDSDTMRASTLVTATCRVSTAAVAVTGVVTGVPFAQRGGLGARRLTERSV